MKLLRMLVSMAIVLAMLVIILGAYTRLTDAGLGCPDWPGCYGFLKVPQHETHVAIAEARFPERPVEAHKAWNEMIHRYFAGSLGLLIAGIFLLSWRLQQKVTVLPTVLLALVVFQAALGMWTVTLSLFPLVVMGHYDPSVLYYIGRYGWEEDPYLWTPFDEQSAIRKGARAAYAPGRGPVRRRRNRPPARGAGVARRRSRRHR